MVLLIFPRLTLLSNVTHQMFVLFLQISNSLNHFNPIWNLFPKFKRGFFRGLKLGFDRCGKISFNRIQSFLFTNGLAVDFLQVKGVTRYRKRMFYTLLYIEIHLSNTDSSVYFRHWV